MAVRRLRGWRPRNAGIMRFTPAAGTSVAGRFTSCRAGQPGAIPCLEIRDERHAHVHQAFVPLACRVIGWKQCKAPPDRFRDSLRETWESPLGREWTSLCGGEISSCR